MRFRPLEKLINLHEGYRREFRIDELALLLAMQDGELYLFESRCPHREHALDVASIGNGVIECPLHRYRFRLTDGALLQASEEPCRALKTWPLVYEGNEVGCMLPD
ncbi:MAG TPA: Rieske (2Fe-2S) protein [Halieaceae bacterium]|jgi:nitrite reductase/ring-hydroxylating ferredoxin subunit|uniref:Rieske (2Fe-2S) protein n=1 Tax=Haliea TaxID=475794 RepID=UPI000C5D05BE|nr:Rieske (2Fe-2S) protein [Haliea sp.]HBQ39924.1 Rieske (2Fe-2S) protein [Halieaceae bacterium]MAY91593.1 Rieske (2Fe-2S) protein [Haliea sp.]MBK40576.1 Rieske (2Fe-2S) protein [Haliea sp.]MBP68675.1 Rieske (2Fe-2S) protein [Haliea sp.]HBX73884.1 Rieske (2Fe-2S) protein [Halieaceae bacterium]|tara:strand:+ start:7922 stop:8239 length:318 start_codon:yes stop_codon:yes gene_type:complete